MKKTSSFVLWPNLFGISWSFLSTFHTFTAPSALADKRTLSSELQQKSCMRSWWPLNEQRWIPVSTWNILMIVHESSIVQAAARKLPLFENFNLKQPSHSVSHFQRKVHGLNEGSFFDLSQAIYFSLSSGSFSFCFFLMLIYEKSSHSVTVKAFRPSSSSQGYLE